MELAKAYATDSQKSGTKLCSEAPDYLTKQKVTELIKEAEDFQDYQKIIRFLGNIFSNPESANLSFLLVIYQFFIFLLEDEVVM